MICNGDPVFFLAGMPGKELKMEKKINRGVIRTGETDIKVHLIDSFPNHPYLAIISRIRFSKRFITESMPLL